MRILVYILSALCNFVLLILQSTLFPYLFGHCHECLGIILKGGKDPYQGIDFSRDEWALGRSFPFDANDLLIFFSWLIFIIFTFLSYKATKKFNKNWQKILYFIITIAFLWIQNRCVISAGLYM